MADPSVEQQGEQQYIEGEGDKDQQYQEQYQEVQEQQYTEAEGDKEQQYQEQYQEEQEQYAEGEVDKDQYQEQYQDQDPNATSDPSQTEGEKDPTNTYNVYVGGLAPDVTEQDLIDAFQTCGSVISSRIFRDVTGEPMGYGFVHFENRDGQQKALSDEFNRVKIRGKQTFTKPAVEKTTLFVGNLPTHLKESEIADIITKIVGPVQQVTLKTGPPPECQSRGFCFVQFDTHHNANRAFKTLSRTPVHNKPLRVGWAESKPSPDEEQAALAESTTLFVNNLAYNVTEEQLRGTFGKFGELLKARIIANPHTNQSRGFAFVEYKSKEEADSASVALNNTEFVGSMITVIRARPDTRTTATTDRRPRGGGPMRSSRGYDGMCAITRFSRLLTLFS